MNTERPSPRYSNLDLWEPADILDAMIEGQLAAVAAVRAVRPAIERAALATEALLNEGGRLIYAGAGTSGRLAVQDGAELSPTFSWPSERLLLLMAGGDKALTEAIAGSTRMKAGTAQKITLNLLSSLVMIRLGRVFDGLMVDVQATNAKLVRRSEQMLCQLTMRSREEARDALVR